MADRRRYGVKERKGRWQARPYIPGVGHVWAGTHDTEDEALRAAIEKFDELERLPASKETIQAFADRWMDDYPRSKMSTRKHNKAQAQVLAKEHGKKLLRDFQSDTLTARRWAIKHRGAANTVRAMFNDAKREGLVTKNPFAELGLPASRGRKDIEILSAAEVDHLLELAEASHPKYRFRPFVAFAAYTGMRPSEIYGLEWPDIDFKAQEITVRRQLYRRECSTPKNGKTRKIILPPPADEALRALDKHSLVRLTDETGKERPMDIIFRNKSGAPMSQTTLHFYWVPVRATFGRPKMDFYELRHFCATFLLEMFRAAGEDGASDVATQLGHSDDGKLVRELYGHPDDDLARERLKRLFKTNVKPLRPVEDDEEAANG
jgi:integrase